MSRSGIRFVAGEQIHTGARLRLTIDWPVKLENRIALNFVADAKVVRCHSGEVAAEILRHEFRTRSNRRVPLVAPPECAPGGHPASRTDSA
jgi:hypothetical protein